MAYLTLRRGCTYSTMTNLKNDLEASDMQIQAYASDNSPISIIDKSTTLFEEGQYVITRLTLTFTSEQQKTLTKMEFTKGGQRYFDLNWINIPIVGSTVVHFDFRMYFEP